MRGLNNVTVVDISVGFGRISEALRLAGEVAGSRPVLVISPATTRSLWAHTAAEAGVHAEMVSVDHIHRNPFGFTVDGDVVIIDGDAFGGNASQSASDTLAHAAPDAEAVIWVRSAVHFELQRTPQRSLACQVIGLLPAIGKIDARDTSRLLAVAQTPEVSAAASSIFRADRDRLHAFGLRTPARV